MSKSQTKKSRADRARDIALYRYSLIRPLADPGLSPTERGRLVRELAAQVHLGPSGEPVTVSRASLDRWIRAWRAGGFDALIPAERQVAPRTDAEVLELAARLKREHPARTAAHIARIIEPEQGWAPSPRTLQRHFARLELTTRPDGMPPKAFGRFEAAEPDELWVSDGLHGPIVDGRRAVLFALLDDHSRYVVGHRWGHGEDTLGMQAALHDAVKTHGCPQKAVLRQRQPPTPAVNWPGRRRCSTSGWCTAGPENRRDAGKSSAGTAPCATSSWSRSTGGRRQVGSLAELNRLFTAWCTSSTTAACIRRPAPPRSSVTTPRDRARPPRPDPALLRRAFLWREQRRVTASATVSLHGNRYQVDAALVGRVVDLLFTPFDLTVIEVEYQGRAMGRAVPHTIGRHVHPAVKPGVAAPVEATGIDYLHLLEKAHQADVGQAINYPALADDDHIEQPRHDQTSTGKRLSRTTIHLDHRAKPGEPPCWTRSNPISASPPCPSAAPWHPACCSPAAITPRPPPASATASPPAASP